jgi:hypothetical protein
MENYTALNKNNLLQKPDSVAIVKKLDTESGFCKRLFLFKAV